MARSAPQVLAGLQSLPAEGWGLPPQDDPASNFARLLAAPAAETARAEARAEQLLVEADPRATTDLLAEWERLLGLPDPCAPNLTAAGGATVAQRRARVVQRLTGRPRARPADYVALAASLGVAITITEFRHHTCELSCEAPLYDPAWDFAWQATAPATLVIDATCEDGAETPLRIFGDPSLECFIRRAAPPHTIVLFAYA